VFSNKHYISALQGLDNKTGTITSCSHVWFVCSNGCYIILKFLFSVLLNQSVRNATGKFLCIIQQMLRGTGVDMRAL